jgi:hypothetical protein
MGGLWFPAGEIGKIRAADAKEVGVGNPAEETYCYPNEEMLQSGNNLSTVSRKKTTISYVWFVSCFASPKLDLLDERL